MPRIKIEDTLPTGEKISIVIEGRRVDEKRVLQVLEMLKIMSGPERGFVKSERSLSEVIWEAIVDFFGDGYWFTLRDLMRVLNEEYGLGLKINVVSTYLLRFYKRGLVDRRMSANGFLYRVAVERVVSKS